MQNIRNSIIIAFIRLVASMDIQEDFTPFCIISYMEGDEKIGV